MQTIRAAVCRAFGEPLTVEDVHIAVLSVDRLMAHADYLSDVSAAHVMDTLGRHFDAVGDLIGAHDEQAVQAPLARSGDGR